MITQQEYANRRKKLAQSLPDNTIAIVPAAFEVLRNGDAHYRFRQDSDFYYLTGFNEPDALLLINSGKGESILFNRPRHPEAEQWTGTRLGQEGAKEVLGVDSAWPIDSLNEKLADYLTGKSAVYYAFNRYPEMEKQVNEALQQLKSQIRRGIKAPQALYDLTPVISEMRLIKNDAEINLMRKAAAISVDAHKRAMKRCRELDYEYQLEAELTYEFYRQGCRSVAYDPIVGSGANACILHYTENNSPLTDGDLILIDAGGEYEGYAADITRSFPRNGSFSDEQRKIYQLVLEAQKAGIDQVKPGAPWVIVQQRMIHIITAGLCELGLLKGKVEDLVDSQAYQRFYMHNSGHWLGLDVHDCGAYKVDDQWRPFEPGMVLTVEPGIYIRAGMEGVDERWWNIGVRIEDDILVTENGNENLTARLPVEINDIEALMRD